MLASERPSPSILLAVPLILFATGCVEAYAPRPSPRLAIVQEGSAARLAKDGRSLPLGDIDRAVRGNPRAEAEAEGYAGNETGGIVFGVLGGVSLGVGTFLLVDDAVQTQKDNRGFPTAMGGAGIGLLAGSVVFNIVSGVMRNNARTHLQNAVNIYNDELEPARGYGPPPYGVPAPGYRPLPSFQGPPPGYGPPPVPLAPPGAPPGLVPSPPPGAPLSPPPVQPLPPGALPPAGSQPVPLER